VLHQQETEISHELAAAFRQLDSTYVAMQNGLNRKLNAEQRLRAVEVQRLTRPDRVTADTVLRAHDQYVQTQSAFVQSIVEYNVAVLDLHYRTGTLLGMYRVFLSEGPWTPEARFDAVEKAAHRAHTIPTATMLHAEPEPFAIPAGFAAPAAPPAAGPAFYEWPVDESPAPGANHQIPTPGSGAVPPGDSVPPRFPPPQPGPPDDAPPAPYLDPPAYGPMARGSSANPDARPRRDVSNRPDRATTRGPQLPPIPAVETQDATLRPETRHDIPPTSLSPARVNAPAPAEPQPSSQPAEPTDSPRIDIDRLGKAWLS
jgi:hypothetical protein